MYVLLGSRICRYLYFGIAQGHVSLTVSDIITVNSEIIACIYYCDFVILDLNAFSMFTILRKILLNSYKIF